MQRCSSPTDRLLDAAWRLRFIRYAHLAPPTRFYLAAHVRWRLTTGLDWFCLVRQLPDPLVGPYHLTVLTTPAAFVPPDYTGRIVFRLTGFGLPPRMHAATLPQDRFTTLPWFTPFPFWITQRLYLVQHTYLPLPVNADITVRIRCPHVIPAAGCRYTRTAWQFAPPRNTFYAIPQPRFRFAYGDIANGAVILPLRERAVLHEPLASWICGFGQPLLWF